MAVRNRAKGRPEEKESRVTEAIRHEVIARPWLWRVPGRLADGGGGTSGGAGGTLGTGTLVATRGFYPAAARLNPGRALRAGRASEPPRPPPPRPAGVPPRPAGVPPRPAGVPPRPAAVPPRLASAPGYRRVGRGGPIRPSSPPRRPARRPRKPPTARPPARPAPRAGSADKTVPP